MASIFNTLRFHVKDRLTVDGILRVQHQADFTGATVTNLGTVTNASFTGGSLSGVAISGSSITTSTASLSALTITTADTSIVLNESTAPTTANQLFRNKNDVADTFDFRLNGSGSVGARVGSIDHSANQPITISQAGLERMRVDIGGNVGIGTSSPGSLLHVAGTAAATQVVATTLVAGDIVPAANPTYALQISGSGSGPGGISQEVYAASAALAPSLSTTKSAGTTSGSFTAVASGAVLYSTTHRGADGSAFSTAATLRVSVDGTVSSGVVPGRFSWLLKPFDGGTFAEKMRLSSHSNLILNGTAEAADAVGALHVINGTAPSAGVANGAVMYAEDVSSSSVMKVMNEDGGVGIVALSSGTTGGTGSAGAGNQYVELRIGPTVYKLLHDGTA